MNRPPNFYRRLHLPVTGFTGHGPDPPCEYWLHVQCAPALYGAVDGLSAADPALCMRAGFPTILAIDDRIQPPCIFHPLRIVSPDRLCIMIITDMGTGLRRTGLWNLPQARILRHNDAKRRSESLQRPLSPTTKIVRNPSCLRNAGSITHKPRLSATRFFASGI